ncbi:hypothetical protein M514_14422 [Trichuris suis]|uniref:Uncharacterized protein n=1 Tax=Trichuris suis TaxID=68888 RepID=A0A085NBM1_9BILA|nr:hypothetical protein M514_14422 [Trichuris suis]
MDQGCSGSWLEVICLESRLTEPIQWKYCPTKHNPADMLSRERIINKLRKEVTWWHAPSWLMKE